jgi:hypothetical protein
VPKPRIENTIDYARRKPKRERAIAEQLRAIFRDFLQTNDVRADVPISEYSIDSLSGVTIIARAARMGIILGLSSDFEMLSILDLAHRAFKEEHSRGNETGPKQVVNTLAPMELLPADVKQILERDARSPYAAFKPTGGLSACARGDLDTAKRFGDSVAFAVDRHCNNALMWACGSGHLAVARWLCVDQCVPANHANKEGRTAIMWACKNGHTAVVKWLAEEGGADLKRKMNDGTGLFEWAVYGGNISTTELLLTYKDVDIHAVNNFGCGAAFWAAAAGRLDMCKWLLAHGVDFHLVNDAGNTVVSKAAWKGWQDLLVWCIEAPDGPRLAYQLRLRAADCRRPFEKAQLNMHTAVGIYLREADDRFNGPLARG